MADNILRLKVESSEYDAKLKKAAEGIRHLAEVAHRSGGELTGLEKAELDYVKGLGTMETKSRTAAGSVRELESTFKELTVVYNHLNDVEKQDEGGKALRASLDQIKQRAQAARAELEAASKSLQGMETNSKVDIGGGLFSGLGSKMEGALAVFGGNLMTKAAGAVAQLGSEMADMVKQGIEMAKAGEGVRIAFERLGRGDILDGLREATHGTVTDLELMKAAVKFNDFKLPLEELGTMLAFAQQKAKDTGQSVDYMVDSIVTGLGRKSLMILDNLGLSAAEIKERMKETGDMTKAVGSIIRDQMKNAGDYVETAADRAAQANVSLQNKMEELGRKFAPVEEASNQLWTSMKIGILDIIGGPLATLLNNLTEAGRLRNQLNKMNGDPSTGQPTKVQQQLSTLRGSKYKNANYKGQLSQYDKQIGDLNFKIAAYGGKGKDAIERGQVQQLKLQRDALKAMRSEYIQGAKDIMKPVETNVKTDKAEQNVKTLTAQLKELEKQRKDAVKKGDQEQVEALTKQISQTKTNLGYLDPKADKSTTGGNKTDIKFASDSIMAQEKLVSDLTQKWKTASGELRDGYLKDLDAAKAKLKEMTDVADPLKAIEAQFQDRSASNYDTGYQGSQQAKEDGIRGDFAYSREAFQQAPLSTQGVEQFISETKSLLSQADIGSELYEAIYAQLSDSSQVSQLLQQYIANGITGAELGQTAQELKDKLMNGEIDDDTMQQYVDQLNAKLKEKFDEEEWPNVLITFDADTNKIVNAAKQQEKEAQNTAKAWNAAASAVSSVGAAMKEIEDPGIKAMGTVIQSIASIALGFAQASVQASSLGPWGWLAFLGAGSAAMATTISTVHSLTGFANGGVYDGPSGFVPGNKQSGDNVMANGGTVGLNSGELILNRAQQGVIAQELEGGGFDNLQLEAVIGAEEIMLVTNNRGNRTQRGEYVQSNNRRG